MSLRERINSDRRLQLGLGAVLLLVVVFFLMHKGGGEGEEVPVEEAVTGVVEEAPVGIETAAATEGSLGTASAAVPAPPMPPRVAAAYEANELVGVLIVRKGGIDDKLVKRYTDLIRSKARSAKGLKLFVVPVQKIAKYGALTLGLNVQRVPALIVLRPKSLSGGRLEASVLYGYQTPASIGQALIDATYHGREGSYHPG